MTAIAYRDGILAADSLITQDGNRCGFAKKIAQGPSGLLGATAGSLGDNALFLSWVEKDCEGDSPPFGDNFDALIVFPDRRTVYVARTGVFCEFDAPFCALGSGSAVCLGAMEAGAGAQQAVEAAVKHEIGCGGPVEVLRLG